jgi:4-hydroxybenzoate polyprenyltransferase
VSGGSTREGQTFAGRTTLVRYANLVKLPHTLFALPFALVGAVLASYVKDVTTASILWVALAFASARYAAMAFNRIVDRRLDALNPRTAMREIPSGAISVREAGVAVVLSSALFLASAWQLNPLCFALAPVALIWVLGYSYTKRFTRLAHLALGLGLGIAPVGGYLAVTGAWSDPWWMLPVLAVGVMTWVAGFDVLYALQDLDFDRQAGLHSIPAALGVCRALVVARVLHAGTVIALAAVGSVVGAGWLYWAGVAVVAALLLFEHSLVRADDLSRLDAAFFTMNAIISIAFFGFVLAERLVR